MVSIKRTDRLVRLSSLTILWRGVVTVLSSSMFDPTDKKRFSSKENRPTGLSESRFCFIGYRPTSLSGDRALFCLF